MLKVNGERNVVMFCRGIGESPLPTSPRWSTRARVYLLLIHVRIKCSLRVDSLTLRHGESSTTAHNLSWVIHKLRRMITKLLITTKLSR